MGNIKKTQYKSLPKNAIKIPNCPTYYATPKGDIWREHYAKRNFGNPKLSIIKLKPYSNPNNQNYCQVQLYINGKKKLLYVHRLILETFTSQIPDNCECDHIDSNVTNNNISNLRWVTHKENLDKRIKKVREKKVFYIKRERQPVYNTKLKPYKNKIDELVDQGYNRREITEMLNLPCNYESLKIKTNQKAREKRLINKAIDLATYFKNTGRTKSEFFKEYFAFYKLLNEKKLWKEIWLKGCPHNLN